MKQHLLVQNRRPHVNPWLGARQGISRILYTGELMKTDNSSNQCNPAEEASIVRQCEPPEEEEEEEEDDDDVPEQSPIGAMHHSEREKRGGKKRKKERACPSR